MIAGRIGINTQRPDFLQLLQPVLNEDVEPG